MAKKKHFVTQLALGNKAEAMVQQVLFLAGIKSEQNTDPKKNKDYDLRGTLPCSRVFTLEIKYDVYCARSGNIAIEFYNPKIAKDSGLNATKADIWVHIITSPLSVWFCKVDKLKEFCATTTPKRTITAGGDDNSSMWLYEKDVIFEIFQRVDELKPEELLKYLGEVL